MSIEVLPLGMRCNISCRYCYQDTVRGAGNAGHPKYDLGKMKAALEREGYAFTVFGGEPLLVPIRDLEELFRWGQERFGATARKQGRRANGIQTNGTLITDAHLRLFRQYDVGVGLSIDGPGELNEARCGEEETAASLTALDRLLELKLGPSLIVTLSRANGSPDRLPRLLDWFEDLAGKGLRHVNLHLLEVDHGDRRNELALTEDENVDALILCAKLQTRLDLRFEPLTDMVRLLLGEDHWDGARSGVSCVWNGCDPYTTDAVRGVGGQGERLNCGRTYKEGVQFLKAPVAGFERYLALYHTPQAYGGCSGCRFFYACKGQCPGTSEGGDWRGKTEHCGILMRVFGMLEAGLAAQGKGPLSLDHERRARVEKWLVGSWSQGQRASVVDGLAQKTAEPGAVAGDRPHGDAPHGDIPHGDHSDVINPLITHEDHTDAAVEEARALWQGL